MSSHPTDFKGSILDALRASIAEALPEAVIDVTGGEGHYVIDVTSALFEGKSTLERQRSVYSAIAHLMQGDRAPVHAVDRLLTRVP